MSKIEDCKFDFAAKAHLESQVSNLHRRSNSFRVKQKQKKFDIWDLKPLNFNPKTFEPKPLKRNSRAAIKPWTYKMRDEKEPTQIVIKKLCNKRRNEKTIKVLQTLVNESKEQSEKKEWQTFFSLMDPHEAKVDFVKNGMFKPSQYKMPQPFDHRQYSAKGTFELPEFDSGCRIDSSKIQTSRVLTIHGPQVSFGREVDRNTKRDYENFSQLHYDPKLILPKLPFPNKSAAYSRHRRTDRTARSAYLDRADEMMKRRKYEIEKFRISLN